MKSVEKYTDTITGEKLTKKTYANGDIRYYNSKNQKHRTDGPAIEYSNGSKYWYQNDKLHRTDGPAVIYKSGYIEWYLNGKTYTELEFRIQVRKMKMENL